MQEKGLNLKIAYVDGDNLTSQADKILSDIKTGVMSHLDRTTNANIHLEKDSLAFLEHPEEMPIVTANAYLGYRAIKRGLDAGADIVICGRVADASPVIGAAAWWHGWPEDQFDARAGALVSGHLIECSTYVTGANFAGFYKYKTQELLNLCLPIVEIDHKGDSTVTKHESLHGIITTDTVKCQLLYELQGNIYLNSDVKADLTNIAIVEEGPSRVHISGIKGYPPPSTTKLAVFYRGGFQCEGTFNATGYAIEKKWDLQEAQLCSKLKEWDALDKFDILDFQRIGVPKENPDSQLASTTYLRLFAQARNAGTLGKLAQAWMYNGMAHFAGMIMISSRKP